MLLPGRKEGKVSLLVGDRGKPQKSGERCCSGGVPECGCCCGRGKGAGGTARAPALPRVTLTRGTLCEQLGIFTGLGRGIFKPVFSKCSVCPGGAGWGVWTYPGDFKVAVFSL